MCARDSRAGLDRVAELLAEADSALFVTGAGISADSGLPTYRGVGGLYEDLNTEEGVPIEVLLSGETFARRPDLTWKYIGQIEEACRHAKCNGAHRFMARLECVLDRVCVLTQNVDGLHRQAGSEAVIDIHGDIHHLLCTRCEHGFSVEDYAGLAMPPHCGRCDGLVRPDVVLFGEMLPVDKIERLRREVEQGFDVVFSIGTSSLFPYIAAPLLRAKAQGQPTVEINPAETGLSGEVDVKLALGAEAACEGIWTRFVHLRGLDPNALPS